MRRHGLWSHVAEISQTDNNDFLKTKEEFYNLPSNEILRQFQTLKEKAKLNAVPTIHSFPPSMDYYRSISQYTSIGRFLMEQK